MTMEKINMRNQVTRFSKAYLVGRIKTNIRPNELSPMWKNAKLSETEYSTWCRYYYKSHVDAMVEAGGQQRPRFLNDVCHYILPISVKGNIGQYQFIINSIHLYYFPLGITLVALEIEDSGNTLDDLTLGHGKLMNWNRTTVEESFPENVKTAVAPLAKLIPSNDLSQLCSDGNKLKLYQVVNVSPYPDTDMDALLYELGTSSPIDCVNGRHRLTPSTEYYQSIMKENRVSTFKDWTALALVDSFTFLSGTLKDDKYTWDEFYIDWTDYYFQLIYLRCIFEKTFCFSRNNTYRSGKSKGNLSRQIAMMEKFYFYDNISYNFQPRLLYEYMAKGLGIKKEREELAKQIKEKEEKNNNLLFGAVSVFAIFSVVYDFYSLIKAWSARATFIPSGMDGINLLPVFNSTANDSGELPLFAFILSIVALILTFSVIWYLKSQRRK